ncbi:MAG: hypothetical protein FJX95_09895 [Bacteroidetes bacterium]|nr:hypothetical protein [Bacteroidota bacterium]
MTTIGRESMVSGDKQVKVAISMKAIGHGISVVGVEIGHVGVTRGPWEGGFGVWRGTTARNTQFGEI